MLAIIMPPGHQRIANMDQRARQIVHGVEHTETDDEIEVRAGIRAALRRSPPQALPRWHVCAGHRAAWLQATPEVIARDKSLLSARIGETRNSVEHDPRSWRIEYIARAHHQRAGPPAFARGPPADRRRCEKITGGDGLAMRFTGAAPEIARQALAGNAPTRTRMRPCPSPQRLRRWSISFFRRVARSAAKEFRRRLVYASPAGASWPSRANPPAYHAAGRSPAEIRDGATCAPCLARPPRHDGIAAATLYNDTSRKLVLALKHGSRIALAPDDGAVDGRQARFRGRDQWLAVPVPLHRWRLWQRGFNQAAVLAR